MSSSSIGSKEMTNAGGPALTHIASATGSGSGKHSAAVEVGALSAWSAEDFINHLKPLHMKGHINETPINHMLVDNGGSMSPMPYSLYKKLGSLDERLIKTSMMINGVEDESFCPSKGIASMEAGYWE